MITAATTENRCTPTRERAALRPPFSFASEFFMKSMSLTPSITVPLLTGGQSARKLHRTPLHIRHLRRCNDSHNLRTASVQRCKCHYLHTRVLSATRRCHEPVWRPDEHYGCGSGGATHGDSSSLYRIDKFDRFAWADPRTGRTHLDSAVIHPMLLVLVLHFGQFQGVLSYLCACVALGLSLSVPPKCA
jgi:hypothetical protein